MKYLCYASFVQFFATCARGEDTNVRLFSRSGALCCSVATSQVFVDS